MLLGADPCRVRFVAHSYPPLNLQVRTPRVVLAGATDDLLERLIPLVRAGVVGSGPLPFDDPMSLYEDSPEREWRWLRGIWAGRAHVDQSWWRLYFVVMADGEPAGMQDLLGVQFAGLAAREATSEAFVDNNASNRVSQALGYEPNGTSWATRRGEPALITRWRLTRDRWETTRRDDIEITGVQDC